VVEKMKIPKDFQRLIAKGLEEDYPGTIENIVRDCANECKKLADEGTNQYADYACYERILARYGLEK